MRGVASGVADGGLGVTRNRALMTWQVGSSWASLRWIGYLNWHMRRYWALENVVRPVQEVAGGLESKAGVLGVVAGMGHFCGVKAGSVSVGLVRRSESDQRHGGDVLLMDKVGLHEGVERGTQGEKEAVAYERLREDLAGVGCPSDEFASADGELERCLLVLLKQVVPRVQQVD